NCNENDIINNRLTMIDIYFLILILFCLIFLGALFEAPWVPTRKKDFDRIAKLASLRPDMLFYDLGSGSGEMLFYLSKKYDVNCVGIEISPLLYLYSKIKSLFFSKVKIRYGNFYKYDLSKADVVYVFLMPKTYHKLKVKISSELKEGAMVILSCWPFEDCKPTKINEKENSITYYLYIM
ncbi:MAG: class I SAM-dependent methyltransferase, partial [bacterium]|nr:class I SAM-dependent methyltransferase [bacterium]